MKKFTFLLSSLLAFAGVTASAQSSYSWKKLSADANVANAVTDLSTLQDGGTYAFYSVGQSKYIKINKYDYNNLHFGRATTLTVNDEDAGLAVFKFHITKDGENTTYTFETAVDGMYMPIAEDNNKRDGAKATKTPASFVIQNHTVEDNPTSKTDGSFVIKNVSNNLAFDMGGDDTDQFCGWQGKGDNCWYKIVPVTISDETVSVYKTNHLLKDGDNTVTSYSEWLKQGTTPSAHTFLTSYYYYDITIPELSAVSESNHEFVYTATKSEMPFSADKFYAIKINGNRYFTAIKDNGTWRINTFSGDFAASSYDIFAAKNWKFVESGTGVKVYNSLAHKYIKVNGGNAASLDDDGTELYFVQTGSNYALKTSTTNQYLNSSITYNGGPNNRLAAYTEPSISNGSTIAIQDINANSDLIIIGKTALTNSLTIANADADKYLTFDASAYTTAKNNVESATTVEALNTICDGFTSSTITPDVNAFYRIKNVGAADGNAYLSTDEMFVGKDGTLNTSYNQGNAYDGKNLNRTITRATASAAFGPQIWRFVKTNGGYQLKNVNTRCNSAFFTNGNLDMPVDENHGQSISLKPALTSENNADNSYVSIVFNNDNYIGVRGDNYYGTNADAASNKNNIWQIEKVTSVPVNITDVKYASVAYPFATQVTGDVKAYYATDAQNGEITLKEFADGIIPANQGAVLYNESGATTATLNIVTTNNTVEGNILNPATAKRAGFDANSTYVLAKNSAGEAAFLKSALTEVPANKAYIDATQIPAETASNALNFNFGTVTGINTTVAADKAGVEYYDLQGRRVLYPTHGIFVTNTGKKVLVK